MVLNTTSGPRPKGETTDHVVNTSRVVEEDLHYEDEEPEILAVLPGVGWCALVDGDAVPLVAWVALDSGRMYGVTVREDGLIDLTNNVEKLDGFAGYKQTNNEEENKNG